MLGSNGKNTEPGSGMTGFQPQSSQWWAIWPVKPHKPRISHRSHLESSRNTHLQSSAIYRALSASTSFTPHCHCRVYCHFPVHIWKLFSERLRSLALSHSESNALPATPPKCRAAPVHSRTRDGGDDSLRRRVWAEDQTEISIPRVRRTLQVYNQLFISISAIAMEALLLIHSL